MDDTLLSDSTPEQTSKIQEIIQLHLLEIEQIRKAMKRAQSQINASAARTDANLIHIQGQLTKLRAN